MINECKSINDIDCLLKYIDGNYKESIYLYLDANKYGISNSKVRSWIQKDNNQITSVILMYHNGMHIYSKEKLFDVSEVVELILFVNPTMICAEARIINLLSDYITGYEKKIGFVAQFTGKNNCNEFEGISMANPSDYKKMAEMLLNDEIGNSYSLEELEAQIAERIQDGYSRSYCLYKDGDLVAQASTGAEGEGIATIAYVITNQHFRGHGYGKAIVTYLCNELVKEGFEVFLIYYSSEAGKLYLKNGFENVCEYGKLYCNVQ